MKQAPRFLFLAGLSALLAAALYSGCRTEPPASPPRTAAAPKLVSPPAPDPGTSPSTRWHDGRVGKSGVWAADEMQVVLVPGASAPEGAFTRSDSEAGVKTAPARDRGEFVARAKEIERRPGVKEVRPVFYETPEAMEKRSLGQRLILTRRVIATLPEGAAPEVLAARYQARVLSKLDFMPRTWVFEVAGPFDALDVASAWREKEGLTYAAPQFAQVRDKRRPARRLVPADTLFVQQWHLRNTGQGGGTAGQDINVVPAWDTVLGTGVVIGIVDNGLEHTHEDLVAGYSAALSLNLNTAPPTTDPSDPTPASTADHGTACAGLACARQNNGPGGTLGVSGVAPGSTLAGIRLTADAVTDDQEATAMAHQNAAIHVKSNSWGPADDGASIRRPGLAMVSALLDGTTNGRGGLGVVYTWAGGNGRTNFDNSNLDGYANQRHVIATAAVNRQGNQTTYSERGANIFISAPGGQADITTTDLNGARGDNATDYLSNFDGTSASTPIVAGVAALMLQRNPNLSARDVQHVLARTARMNLDGSGWVNNAAATHPNQAPFHVNHKYGFGVVDAAAAVDLAGRWPHVGPVASRSAASGTVAVPIPQFPGATVVQTLDITGTPFRAEHVEVDFSGTQTFRGDYEVTLVSPAGTRSLLIEQRNLDNSDEGFDAWTLLSVRTWGESAVGIWTLEVRDAAAGDLGTFTGWTLRVFGTPIDVTPPVAGAVNDGPGADVDVLASTTSVQANWTGFSDPDSGIVFEWAVGTTAGGAEVAPFVSAGYATSATRGGLALVGGTPYFVTVRATNFDGLQTVATSDGFMVDGLPPDPPTGIAASPGASATGLFTVTWVAPADPGGSGVASYTLERSRDGGAFANVASGIAALFFDADVSGAGPGSFVFRVRAVDAAGNVGTFSSDSAAVLYDPSPPTVAITSPATDPASTGASPLALAGTAGDNVGVVAVSWVNARTGLGGVAAGTTGWSASVGLLPGANAITVFAWDALGNATSATVAVTFTPGDVLPPSITISTPAGDTFATSTATLALQGASFDNTGVTSIEWTNLATGLRGAVPPNALWSANVPLLAGVNAVVVTARDAAGNATSDLVAVTFTPAADAVAPTAGIIGPTNQPTFPASSSPLSLSGTASDDVAIAYVRWSNAATGGGGTADGTAIWTAVVALAPGVNVVTATAVDASGNETDDVLTVTFTPPAVDAILPVIEIQSPTSGAAFGTSTSSIVIAGIASDNDEVVEVTWTNAETGESGTATGVGGWSALIPLLAGANTITVAVFDPEGHRREDVLTVTFTPPGGGGSGGGGCGATGLELLLLAPFLRRRRR